MLPTHGLHTGLSDVVGRPMVPLTRCLLILLCCCDNWLLCYPSVEPLNDVQVSHTCAVRTCVTSQVIVFWMASYCSLYFRPRTPAVIVPQIVPAAHRAVLCEDVIETGAVVVVVAV